MATNLSARSCNDAISVEQFACTDATSSQEFAPGSKRCLSERIWLTIWIGLFAWLLFPAAQEFGFALTHGSLRDNIIPVLSIVLLVAGIRHLRGKCHARSNLSFAGLASLLTASTLCCVAASLHMHATYNLALVGLIGSFVWALGGSQRILHYLPACLFACFLQRDIPEDIRLNIAMPLQMVCCKGAVALAGLLIPISSAGHIFYINKQGFDVEPGCSGLNMWLTLLFIFAAWQLFQRFKWQGYLAVAFVIPVVAVVLNTMRLFVTALVAHFGSPAQAMAIHSNLEAVVLPLGLVAIYCIRGRYVVRQAPSI